ncbi:MAG: hypothetical protein DWQ34_21785 [Planctomycetota bacterium]|nr:MAG: hypothetical protein DWQ34_21785 [Planctomycetota bacterium]
MSNALFSASAVERVGWLLIHSVWQFTLIALTTFALLRLLYRSSPNIRYTVTLASMFCIVIMPVATWALLPADPLNPERIAAQPGNMPTVIESSEVTTGPRPENITPQEVPPIETTTAVESLPPEATASLSSSPPRVSGSAGWRIRLENTATDWMDELVALWCLGVLMFSVRPLWSCYQLRRLRRVGVSPVPESLKSSLEEIANRLRIRRTVRIMQSSLARVPMVVGYLRPVILLPLSVVSTLPPAQIEGILVHELAHIRRHDFLVNLLQTLLETVCFYHPAVWWISGRVRREREYCCDEVAAGLIGDRPAYARTLLALEELRGSSPVLSLGAKAGSLMNRIQRLTSVRPERRSNAGPAAVAALVIIALLAVGLFCQTSTPAVADDNESDDAAALQAALDKVEHDDPRMVEIIRAVIEQEHRYRHLEYVLHRESYYREDQPNGAGVSNEIAVFADRSEMPPPMETVPRIVETFHVHLDGQRYAFESERKSWTKAGFEQLHRRKAAFDGERTVSIEYDNSANVHLGRYEVSECLNPHSWGTQPLLISSRLSAYLQGGTKPEDRMRQRIAPSPYYGRYEYIATQCEFIEMVTLGDVRCAKIRVAQRNNPDDYPRVTNLWLAPERNYMCAKSQHLIEVDGEELVWRETTVDAFREVETNLWLPSKVSSTHYDLDCLRDGDRVPEERFVVSLQEVAVADMHAAEPFQVDVPDDLPVFTLSTEGLIDSPHHPQPIDEQSETTLEAIVEAVQANSQRFGAIDVTAESDYVHFSSLYHAATGSSGTPYSSRRVRLVMIPARQFNFRETHKHSHNGTWTTNQQSSVGRLNDRDICLPHSWLDWDGAGHLIEMLRSSRKHRVIYEGDDLIDGLLCHRIRRDRMDEDGSTHTGRYIWICPERNYIPLRVEWFQANRNGRLPSSLKWADNFRELEPGIWFPMQWTTLKCRAIDGETVAEKHLIVDWREDWRVTSVSLDPQVDLPDLPQAPIPLPEGVEVPVPKF